MRQQAREHDIRRLRDLIRVGVLHRAYPHGQLPSESELMGAYGVRRAIVRDALALLRGEGLIERVQGIGTHVVVDAVTIALAEAHGAAAPSGDSIFNHRMHPVVLDSSTVPAPAAVASNLRVASGTPCLRLEYLPMLGDEPVGIATNYVLFPEAESVRSVPFVSDWYALLAAAGIELGESEFTIGCVPADRFTAAAVRIREGAALMFSEQVIYDSAGRPFNYAVIHTRADRFLFRSRATRCP